MHRVRSCMSLASLLDSRSPGLYLVLIHTVTVCRASVLVLGLETSQVFLLALLQKQAARASLTVDQKTIKDTDPTVWGRDLPLSPSDINYTPRSVQRHAINKWSLLCVFKFHFIYMKDWERRQTEKQRALPSANSLLKWEHNSLACTNLKPEACRCVPISHVCTVTKNLSHYKLPPRM